MSNFDIRPFALLYMPLPYSYAKKRQTLPLNILDLLWIWMRLFSILTVALKKRQHAHCLLITTPKDKLRIRIGLNKDELKILREYADKVVAQAISEIESGYIEAKAESCDNCEYGRICLKKNNPQNMRKKY